MRMAHVRLYRNRMIKIYFLTQRSVCEHGAQRKPKPLAPKVFTNAAVIVTRAFPYQGKAMQVAGRGCVRRA